jgi:hypothetical protein
MIIHATKPQHLYKIKPAETLQQLYQIILFKIFHGKTVQGGPGHDMINR